MEIDSQHSTTANPGNISLKIFGVGGAGVNVLEQLIEAGVTGASFAAVNTDPGSLLASTAREKICQVSSGFGASGNPERGQLSTEDNLTALKTACAGVDIVFIVAGLGGGAGTGISPLLAQAAKAAGALVLGFVTLPFDFEGNHRQSQARRGLEELKASADGVICLPNQKLFKLIDENTSVLDTFKL